MTIFCGYLSIHYIIHLHKFEWLHSILLHVYTVVSSGGFFWKVDALYYFFLFNALVAIHAHTVNSIGYIYRGNIHK